MVKQNIVCVRAKYDWAILLVFFLFFFQLSLPLPFVSGRLRKYDARTTALLM